MGNHISLYALGSKAIFVKHRSILHSSRIAEEYEIHKDMTTASKTSFTTMMSYSLLMALVCLQNRRHNYKRGAISNLKILENEQCKVHDGTNSCSMKASPLWKW